MSPVRGVEDKDPANADGAGTRWDEANLTLTDERRLIAWFNFSN
jgi:hypothetical protein